MLIFELLARGEENARTAKELAAILDDHERNVTREINRERVELLLPIGSTTDGGYFKFANEEERRKCCAVLDHRIQEQTKTVEALRICSLSEEITAETLAAIDPDSIVP